MECQNSTPKDSITGEWKRFLVPLTAIFVVIVAFVKPVWTGFACLENPCIHGICIDSLDINSTHQCYCINGFTGYSCQINFNECRSSPCLNGGICTDGIASFNCSCPDNFAGALCEYDLSACDEILPCQNNGTCTVDPNSSNGTFMCICPPGFSGSQCDLDISVCNTTENVCLNGGKCVDGIGINFNCQCEPGWTGSLCEQDVDECASQPCTNGGICVNKIDDYSCACPFGYTGKACEIKLRICEVNPCQNDAFCLHEDEDESKMTCYCVPDFHGTLCEFKYDDCDPEPRCFNGGSCIDGVGEFFCSCPTGFFGPTCQCTLDNITEPECRYNGTETPSISEIPIHPSVSITEPAIIITNILSIPVTPLMSTSITSEVFKPEATVSFHSLESQPITSYLESSEARIVTDNLESPEFPGHISTAAMHSELIKPTDLISVIESPKPFTESLLIITPTPEKSFEVGITPTQSESMYDPCPTISLEGTEGLLIPPSMSFLSSPILNNTSGEFETPRISEEFLLSPSAHGTVSIVTSEEVVKSGFPSIALEESSGIFMTMSFISPSVSKDVIPTIIAPPENDIASGTLSMPPLLSTVDVLETPIASESHFYLIPSQSLSPLPFSSKLIEEIETLEFSTGDLGQTLSPSPSEFLVTYMLSPTTSTFPILSPSDGILSPTIIIIRSESVLFATPVIQSDLVTTVIPLKSEAVINASRRSNDVEIPPLMSTTYLVVDSSAMLETASLSVEDIITTMTTATGPSLLPESEIFLSPTPTVQLTTPEPTIRVPTPSGGNLSDACINYCQNNAKCDSSSIQPVCTCPFKFTGDRCEIPRKRFSTSSFTGDSFLGYKVPNESINRINVVIRMATSAPEGILFYTAVSRIYALIFTQGGHVTFHFSCGAQSMHFVETRTRVDNGFNFTLEFKMEMVVQSVNQMRCLGKVSVNESYVMSGEQIIGNNGLYENPTQLIYLGGVGAPNAYKNDELIGILPGFRGCLYILTINQEEKDLFDDAIDGQGVSECSAFGCVANPCLGISKCTTSTVFPFWQCICSPGFQGVKCQIRVCDSNLNPCLNGATCTFSSEENINKTNGESSLEVSPPICLCSLGFSGSVCQSKINITKPSFNPLSGFDYSAFITYEPIPRFIEWVQFKLHFVPRNTSQIALLLYSGYSHGSSIPSSDQLEETLTELVKEDSRQGPVNLNNDLVPQRISDFFAITYVHGYVTLTWNLGSGTQRIITPSRIDRRLNIHTLFAGRSGRDAWLKVDGMRNVTGKSPGPFHRLNVNSELFVGGYESFRFEGLPHDLPLHKGFQGCIFDFGFRIKNRLYLPRSLRGRNVKNCYEEDC